MALSISQSVTAVTANIPAFFLASGGMAPYTYSITSGGAGGTINSRSGAYLAPINASSSPNQAYDQVVATDSTGAKATTQILVASSYLFLVSDIIQQGMGLANGRVYCWDQKLFQPTDYDLYVAVSQTSVKVFANNNIQVSTPTGMQQQQSLNLGSVIDIDIISRGPAARDQKEQVVMTLYSVYSEQQQEINSFNIGRVSNNFINLSNIDGAAIPYRYKISCTIQYAVTQSSPISYYSTFNNPPTLITN